MPLLAGPPVREQETVTAQVCCVRSTQSVTPGEDVPVPVATCLRPGAPARTPGADIRHRPTGMHRPRAEMRLAGCKRQSKCKMLLTGPATSSNAPAGLGCGQQPPASRRLLASACSGWCITAAALGRGLGGPGCLCSLHALVQLGKEGVVVQGLLCQLLCCRRGQPASGSMLAEVAWVPGCLAHQHSKQALSLCRLLGLEPLWQQYLALARMST